MLFTVIAAGSVYGIGAVYSMILPIMTMTPSTFGLGYGFGLDAEGYALFQVPLGVMTMAGGIVVGTLCGRGVPPRSLLFASMVCMGLGAVLTAIQHDSKSTLFVFAGLVGLGMGLGYAAIPNQLIGTVPAQLQASTASIAGVVQSLISAALPVIVFAVMNNSFVADLSADVTGGAVAYSDGGFVAAFVITAVTAVLGVVAVFAIPRHFDPITLPDEAGNRGGGTHAERVEAS